jgi:multidrug efflux pump subunit AcrA (membrane-fusion protein)
MKHGIIIIGGLAAAGIALAGLAGCQSGGDSADASGPPIVAVRARALEERTFNDTVTAEGLWRSSGEVAVTAPFASLVDSLGVQLGDRVTAGQTVARLITREAQATLRGATMLATEAHDASSRAEAARAVALARRELVRVPLTAPRSGVVVRLSATTGSEVAESAEILALLPNDAIVFEAHVPASQAARLRVGQAASILAEGHAPRAAVVQRTLPVAGANDQSTLVWLRPVSDNAPPELDRFGTAVITVGPARRALAVPDSAIVQDDLTGETRMALVASAGQAIWTPAMLGIGAGGWHELTAPDLVPGTLVIVDGHCGLPDSTYVKVAT